MILKKMLKKYSGNHKKMMGSGMMFLILGILLQRISAYMSNLEYDATSPVPFIMGLFMGMSAVFILFSIYLNITGFKIYRRTNIANAQGEE